MDKPLVTVVIPCHNYAQYVTDAIRSVQQQTLNNFECFIVCDSCDDNSEDVIEAAIEGDTRFGLQVVDFRSLSATRNYGIACGSAPFLCCLDADDMMGSEEYLEILVSALEKDRTIGIAFSSIQVMDKDGVLGHVPNWPNGWDFDQQCNHINQIPSLCVFRRDMWERAGGFRPFYQYVEDAEFWTTCGMIGFSAVHATTAPWFHYRLHDKSASQVHRTGEIPEPDWLEYHPGARDGQRPFAAGGKPPRGSWPVRFYNEPDVTIIIPVGRGHEEIVKDALHSVEGQTHRMWECIVINDSGHSLGLKDGFPWARVIEANYLFSLGAGAARNVGLKAAQGDHVVFLDADDMLKPDFLTATLAAYTQHGRYAYTDWLTGDQRHGFERHDTPEYSFEAVRDKPSLHPVTALVPRRWALNVGGFDETLPAFEDVDFFMRLFTHGYCGVRVAQPLMIYNLDTGTRRTKGESYRPEFHKLLTKRYGKFMEDEKMCDCVTPPKGKQPAAPSPENAAEYKAAYGDIVLAKLVGRFTPEAPASFFGPATRVPYGRRAKNDIFYIWQADFENGGDTFELVENFVTEPEPTVVPPAPPEPPTVVEALTQPLTVEGLQMIEGDLTHDEWKRLHENVWAETEGDTEELPHKMTVGERNDTLPPEQTLSYEELQALKKAERNAKDRERRAAKKTGKK